MSLLNVMPITSSYSPFGTVLYGRNWSSEAYRYGFNGKEKEEDIASNDYDFGARIYDGRLGRWWSVDPLITLQASWSSYKAFYNNPTLNIDRDGRTEYQINITKNEKTGECLVTIVTSEKIMTDGVEHVVSTFFDLGGAHKEEYYYDYASITVTTIAADGTETVETSTKILIENGIKDKDMVFRDLQDASPCDTKEEWLGDVDEGVEVSFGLAISGGGDGPIAQDKSKNVIGSIDFGELETILAKSNSTKYLPGSASWKKLTKLQAKDMAEQFKKNIEQGEKIGEIFEAIKPDSKPEPGDSVLINTTDKDEHTTVMGGIPVKAQTAHTGQHRGVIPQDTLGGVYKGDPLKKVDSVEPIKK